MFTPDVPSYLIDLDHDETTRWAEVATRDADVARRLVDEVACEFRLVPEFLRWIFERRYESSGGLYHDEIKMWAERLDVSSGTATMLNCAYELSHIRLSKLLGCTAGVRWTDGLGMVHVRTLDWPLATIGEATRVFRFRRGKRESVAIGVPGQVGILSGMAPGAYSVTINWAPHAARPCFEFGPTFLLRNVLEKCDRYDEAVEILMRTRLATSVFFTVCGTQRARPASSSEPSAMRPCGQ